MFAVVGEAEGHSGVVAEDSARFNLRTQKLYHDHERRLASIFTKRASPRSLVKHP